LADNFIHLNIGDGVPRGLLFVRIPIDSQLQGKKVGFSLLRAHPPQQYLTRPFAYKYCTTLIQYRLKALIKKQSAIALH